MVLAVVGRAPGVAPNRFGGGRPGAACELNSCGGIGPGAGRGA